MAMTARAHDHYQDLPVVLVRLGVDAPYKCAFVAESGLTQEVSQLNARLGLPARR